MARTSPLFAQQVVSEAIITPYGMGEGAVQVVQAYGEVDLEYAAIRRGVGVIDLPQRATIEVTGGDRVDFLNRMLTQELKGFAPFAARRAFWLSRKGKIDADLRLIALPDRLLIDVDVHAAKRALDGLSSYVIVEDAAFVDRTEQYHRLGLHGPNARELVARASQAVAGDAVATLEPGRACEVKIGDAGVIVDRADTTGDVGLELLVPIADVLAVHRALLEAGGFAGDAPEEHGPGWALRERSADSLHARPIGWAAYNVARIEAGTPVYYLDFGPDSLPHETGAAGLSTRVSFTKGCYLGQEIVARMQSLGQPKQKLVALKLESVAVGGGDLSAPSASTDPTMPFHATLLAQPDTAAPVFTVPAAPTDGATAALGEPIGAVTSSAISPMLGGVPVCLAMVKTKFAAAGTGLIVDAEGTPVKGVVQEQLAFWKRA